MILENPKDSIKDIIKNNSKVMLKFGTQQCAPCQVMDRVIDELNEQMPDIIYVKLDASLYREEATKYHISSIPAVIIYKDGKKTNVTTGLRAKDEYIEHLNDEQ